ncbi:hypothetical protein L210DRAFT_935144 [Boletus edulis BED1]|uniref:Uncharacterized protein n=1 Tax=Boletus edulis BED1 TaxID=1328754 RepID=A0AAD4G5A6_BOLED|nr:hypothetical protein L210DRAFT_935144 [Boletus edulis BED1]
MLGTLDNVALIERQAERDIVFACADSDHVESCEAILRGLKKSYEVMGTIPIFVHTLERLPDTDPHRLTDPLVIAADEARTHIELPIIINECTSGKLVSLGICNPRSIEIPKLTDLSITRKRAGMVGVGLNIWLNVHIDDRASPLCRSVMLVTIPTAREVGELYIVLYNAILDGHAGHGREGLYFGENGECVVGAMSEWIGEALVGCGISRPGEETQTSFDERNYTRPENGDVRLRFDSMRLAFECKGLPVKANGRRRTTEQCLAMENCVTKRARRANSSK